ncbi:hypothetical protein BKA56DRAFT_546285 [Ilyonectria sp. MPI-CAGE-AT-0026]|nr:hypothetical protein BKA56DRAFT_546285 [Ilyonectria sp. MPI-CAGE-AT-0026]
MTEALGLVASIIAVVQASDAIIKICKGYIDSVNDYPSDLRRVLLEVSSLKGIFDNLEFLHDTDVESSLILTNIGAKDGPIEGCRRVIADLRRQFPTSENNVEPSTEEPSRKRRKIKDALGRLAWPLKQTKVLGLLNELSQYKSTITTAFSAELVHHVKQMNVRVQRISEAIDAESKRNFGAWLSHTNPSSNHNSACSQYEPGTCRWVLDLPQWKQWLSQDLRCLWIHGIPGAGKTVLFSQLVEAIQSHIRTATQSRLGHVYYYCHHSRNQDELVPFLCWVLWQLSSQADAVPEGIYATYRNGLQPSTPQLLEAIGEMLTCFDAAFIFLDAIDESQPRDLLLKTISDLLGNDRFSKLQLLATSREYFDIQNTMRALPNSCPISMANESLRSDIEIYVMRVLTEDKPFRLWSSDLRAEARNSLLRGAKGMFRWVICQVDLFRRMRLVPRTAILDALRSLPETLDETYERIFSLIPEADRVYLRSALHWIIFLGHWNFDWPLGFHSLSSLAELVLPHWERCDIDETRWEETLLDICGCLIRRTSNDKGLDAIYLAHYTVREFLESRGGGHSASYLAVNTPELLTERLTILFDERPRAQSDQRYDQVPTPEADNHQLIALMVIMDTDVDSQLVDISLKNDSLLQTIFKFISSENQIFYPSIRETVRLPEYQDSTWTWLAMVTSKDVKGGVLYAPGSQELDPDTSLFLALLFIGNDKWMSKFLETANRGTLFQQHFGIRFDRNFLEVFHEFIDADWLKRYGKCFQTDNLLELTGNVIDIICQLDELCLDEYVGRFEMIYQHGQNLFDLGRCLVSVLISAYARRDYESQVQDNLLGVVEKLKIVFKERAIVTFTGSCLAALQLAVILRIQAGGIFVQDSVCFDLVEELLCGGADPNGIGHGERFSREWLTALNSYQGQSPLRICRNAMRGERRTDLRDLEEVEELLIEAGGRDFFELPV